MNKIISYMLSTIGIGALFLSIGCTGTRVMVIPDVKTIEPPITKGCGRVAVTEITKDDKSKIPNELVIGFAKYLEQSGLFDEVYCPVRPTDKFDISIDTKFAVRLDSHTGPNFAKAFITGLSWFVLEPIFWYEQSLDFSGHVDVMKDGKTVATFDRKTKADLYKKFLPLTTTKTFQKELWPNSLNSIYSQLSRDIETYCKQKSADMKTLTKID